MTNPYICRCDFVVGQVQMSDFQRSLEKNEQTHCGNKNNFRKLSGNEIVRRQIAPDKYDNFEGVVDETAESSSVVTYGRCASGSREQHATRPDTYYFLDRYFG